MKVAVYGDVDKGRKRRDRFAVVERFVRNKARIPEPPEDQQRAKGESTCQPKQFCAGSRRARACGRRAVHAIIYRLLQHFTGENNWCPTSDPLRSGRARRRNGASATSP